MAARAPVEFLPMFAEIKSGYDLRGSARQPTLDGLVCKQGFYKGCAVLKLQKASWTNDPMHQVKNKTGIFFRYGLMTRQPPRTGLATAFTL